MIPLMTIYDNIDFYYSKLNDNKEVEVYIEQNDYDIHNYLTVFLPSYRIIDIEGFTEEDIKFLVGYVKELETTIIDKAKKI